MRGGVPFNEELETLQYSKSIAKKSGNLSKKEKPLVFLKHPAANPI
jgi:hypothetical protein